MGEFYIFINNACSLKQILNSCRRIKCMGTFVTLLLFFLMNTSLAQKPVIAGFSPAGGCQGSNITIKGTGFGNASAVTVKIGGTPVSSIISDNGNTIVAIVGAGTTGPVSVITGSGTGTSAATFTVYPVPSGAITASSSSVCAGSPVTFTAPSGYDNYTWKVNGVTVLGPGSAFTYAATNLPPGASVKAIIATPAGCTATLTAPFVKVNPYPSGNLVVTENSGRAPDDNIICQGDIVNLSFDNARSNINYNFKVNSNSVYNGPNAYFSTNTLTNNASVTVDVTNRLGCIKTFGPEMIMVNANPVATLSAIENSGIPNDNIICVGDNVTFTASPGFAVYDFMVDNISVQKSASPVFSTNSLYDGDFVTVMVANNNKCTKLTGYIAITVKALTGIPGITAAGPVKFCYGGSVKLISSSAGTYQWLKNGSVIIGARSRTYVATTSGVYKVVVTNGNSCGEASSGKTVTVIQPSASPVSATASADTICSGSSTILTLNGGGGGTGEVIHWYAGSCGGIAVGTGNNLSVTPSVTTTYYGRYEDGGPCNFNTSCAAITVTVTPAPSATIVYSGSPYCSTAGTATVTQTGTAGGTYSAAAGLSIDPSTGTINIATSTPGTYTVTYTVAASGGCAVYTTSASVTIVLNTWIGITSSDWNDVTNWSCGTLPGLTTDITINSTPHDPVVSTAIAMVHNLTISSGVSVTVSGQTLQVSGTVTNAGTFDVTQGALELNGSSAQTIAANEFATNKIKDLIISNNVTLNGVDSLTGTLSFGSTNKTFTTNGNLTIKSTVSGTGAVGQILSGNKITGDVTVERYIATGTLGAPNHGKSWQLLAVPTFGSQTIKQSWMEGASQSNIPPVGNNAPGSGGNPVAGYGTMITSNVANAGTQPTPGFDVYTAPGPSMKIYDSISGNYYGTASTQVPVYNQRGYFVFVRGDRSVYTSSGAATPTILRTKGTLFTPANPPLVTNVAANLFESIGNPYASAIDLRNITRTGGVNTFVQVWDPRLGGAYNYGAFQTLSYDSASGSYDVIPGGGSYSGAKATITNYNYIQSGEAFFVQATGGNGTVSFSENCKATGSALFTTPAPVNQLRHSLRTSLNTINADGSTGSIVDGVLSQFDDTYSNAIDGMDARKQGNTGENLSIKTGGKLLVIERRQTIIKEDTILLNITGERAQGYRFHFEAENLDPTVQGYLVDNYANTRTALNMSGSTDVSFTVANVSGSNAASRFMIVFEPLKALPVTFTAITAYKQDKNIDVQWRVDNERNIQQYQVEKSTNGNTFTALTSKQPTANNGGSAVYVIADATPVEGFNYYRVKSTDINGRASYTSVVKVLIGSLKQDITIYPNPITDGMIHLQLMNQPEGKYYIRLLNKLGQLIVQKQVTHAGGSATELIQWDYNLAHGMYQLEVTRPDGTIKDINVMY